jgi:hypothetical protein
VEGNGRGLVQDSGRCLPWGTEKYQKNLCQDSQCPGRNWNQEIFKIMSFIHEPLCSVQYISKLWQLSYWCVYHYAGRYTPEILFIFGNSDRKENRILKSLDTKILTFIYIIYLFRNYALSSPNLQRWRAGWLLSKEMEKCIRANLTYYFEVC